MTESEKAIEDVKASASYLESVLPRETDLFRDVNSLRAGIVASIALILYAYGKDPTGAVLAAAAIIGGIVLTAERIVSFRTKQWSTSLSTSHLVTEVHALEKLVGPKITNEILSAFPRTKIAIEDHEINPIDPDRFNRDFFV